MADAKDTKDAKTNDADAAAPAAPDAQAPAAPPAVNVTVVQQDRHAEAAQAMLEAQRLQLDTAKQPGGSYEVDGKLVNCNGDPVGSSIEKSMR